MNRIRLFALALVALLGLSWSAAQAGVFIGVGVGRPYYRPYWYGPRVVVAVPPVYVGPAPVYVAPPPPVYVQPAPIYAPPPTTVPAAPPPSSTLPPAPVPSGS